MKKISRDVAIMAALLLAVVCIGLYHTNNTIKILAIGGSTLQTTDTSLKTLDKAI